MRKSRPILAAAAVATAFTLTACSTGAPSSDGGDSGPVVLTLATFLDPNGTSGREVVLKKLIDDFEAKNENVTVEVQTSQFTLLTTQFLAGVAANNAPDMTFATSIDVLKMNELGYFSDLSGAIGAEDAEDLQSGSFDGVKVDGAPHAVPLFPIAFGYMYNKDLFTANGVDAASLTTWDAFTDAANKLGAAGAGGFCQGFSESTPDQTGAVAHLLSHAGSLFEKDGTPNWAGDEGVDAVNWAKDLIASGGTPKDAVVWTTEDPYEQFAAGNCAMSMAASSRVGAAQAALGAESVGFALFPSKDGSEPSTNLLGGWTVGVWDGSKNKDLAAEFAASLVSAEADALWVGEAGQAPLRASTAAATELADWLQVAISGVRIGYAPPSGLKADWRPAFNGIMQDVLVNGTDAKDALDSGVEKYLKG